MRRILAAARRGGPKTGFHTVVSRLRDLFADLRRGTRTGGLIPIERLVAEWHGCNDYFPTSYGELRAVLAALAPGVNDVFLDIGAGKGRALVAAAEFPFRALIGVELAPALCAEARVNIARRLGGRDIRVIEADAAGFAIPDAVTLIYLYNPFKRDRLAAVFANISASLSRAPRRISVVFNNPVHFEPIEQDFPWLRREAVHALEYRWIVYSADGRPGIADDSGVTQPAAASAAAAVSSSA